MKKIILLFLFLKSFTLFSQCLTPPVSESELGSEPPCSNNYTSSNEMSYLPTATIRVNVFFLGKPNFINKGANNTDKDNGILFAKQIIDEANNVLSHLQPASTGVASATDAKYRFELYAQPGKESIHFMPNIDDITVNASTLPNKYSVFNIFVAGKTHLGTNGKFNTAGAANYGSDFMLLQNAYELIVNQNGSGGQTAANYGRLMCHEMGHQLYLIHSFSCNLNIPDIDEKVECNSSNSKLCAVGGNELFPEFPNGADCKFGTNNIMSYGDNQNALTLSQFNRQYSILVNSTIANSGYYQEFVKMDFCKPNSFPPLVIPNGKVEIWDHEKYITRDVIVQSGGELHIRCVTRMGPETSITVERGAKLILDNGKLTRLCFEDNTKPTVGMWKGVFVLGNIDKPQPTFNIVYKTGGSEVQNITDIKQTSDDAGIVILKEGSKIEWAKNGISTSAPDSPYPQSSQYHGGLVVAMTRSAFVNNRRAVEFLSYGSKLNFIFPNKSFFDDCDFTEDFTYKEKSSAKIIKGNPFPNSIGVTIWDCKGISFTGNRFTTLDYAGIEGADFSAVVKNKNIFTDTEIGIESYASFSNSNALLVENNEFKNSVGSSAIQSEGYGNLATFRVTNNEFDMPGLRILYFNGQHKVLVKENIFQGGSSQGVHLRNSGAGLNQIHCNIFNGLSTGIVFDGTNTNSNFLKNDFSCSFSDVYVKGFGSPGKSEIKQNQGSLLQGASNCFTINSKSPIRATKTAGSNQFLYHCPSKETKSPSCTNIFPADNITDGGNNTYKVSYLSKEFAEKCKDLNLLSPPPSITRGELETVRSRINEISNIIQQDSSLENIEKLSEYTETKSIILNTLILNAIGAKNYTEVRELLSAEDDIESKKLIYGTYLEEENYDQAQEMLLNLPITDENDADYKKVQLINIDRLRIGETYKLNVSDANYLFDIAIGQSLARPYARALLFILLDMHFPPDIDESAVDRQDITLQNLIKTDDMTIYPNPAFDVLHLAIGNVKIGANTSINISDKLGRLMKKQELKSNGQEIIDVELDHFQNGLYFFTIEQKGAIIFAKKFMVLKEY
jgi:hypothetical protein